MKRLEKWHIYVASVCVILGILVAIQFQTQKSISESAPTRRIEELTAMLKKAEDYKLSLEKESKRLESLSHSNTNDINQEELKKLQILSGAKPLTGPGIVVILDDSKRKPKENEDVNLYLIHNEDILKVVNELWAGGAEAIAVNNQRIVANTEITCAGPTISINKRKLVPPYEIDALGNANTLNAALHLSGGILDTLDFFSKQYGLQVLVQKKEKLVIPALIDEYYFNYAENKKDGV